MEYTPRYAKTPTSNRPTILQANGMIKLDQTKQEIAEYLLGAYFNPAPSTLMRATRKKQFDRMARPNNIHDFKEPPKDYGNCKMSPRPGSENLRSTSSHQDNNDNKDIVPQQEDDNKRRHDIICAVIGSKTLNSKSYKENLQNSRNIFLASPSPYESWQCGWTRNKNIQK